MLSFREAYSLACITIFGMDYHDDDQQMPNYEQKQKDFHELYAELSGQSDVEFVQYPQAQR